MEQNVLCVVCHLPVEPYSCSRKRCTVCIGKKTRTTKFGVCPYCGTYGALTRDHVVPKSRLYSGEIKDKDAQQIPRKGNIIMVCGWCNENKADMLLLEWLETLPPEFPQHIYVPKMLLRLQILKTKTLTVFYH